MGQLLLLAPQMANSSSTTNTAPELSRLSQATPWQAWMLLIIHHSRALWPAVAGTEQLLSGSKVYWLLKFCSSYHAHMECVLLCAVVSWHHFTVAGMSQLISWNYWLLQVCLKECALLPVYNVWGVERKDHILGNNTKSRTKLQLGNKSENKTQVCVQKLCVEVTECLFYLSLFITCLWLRKYFCCSNLGHQVSLGRCNLVSSIVLMIIILRKCNIAVNFLIMSSVLQCVSIRGQLHFHSHIFSVWEECLNSSLWIIVYKNLSICVQILQ